MSEGKRSIIVCQSTNYMLKAATHLEEEEIAFQMVPVPAQYGSVCSTGLKISENLIGIAEKLLKEKAVKIQGIYPYKTSKLEKLVIAQSGKWRRDFKKVMEKLELGNELNEEDVLVLLETEEPHEVEQFFAAADQMRKQTVGDVIDVRAAVEFSNYCRKDCNYCGLRKSNQVPRYRMSGDEILAKAKEIAVWGIKTIILQSGEDPGFPVEDIALLVAQIKRETGMRITLSLGDRSEEEYRILKEVGANNYLLKIETTDKGLYHQYHPDGDWETRKENTRTLKRLGYVMGSGNIIGLPGQTVRSIARDILWMKQEGIHMVGIGPFISARGTPYAEIKSGSGLLSLKTIAATRLVLKNVFIPATTALASIDPQLQKKALQVGANTIMLISTPEEYRKDYLIYNHKKPVDLEWALEMIDQLGRERPTGLVTVKQSYIR